MMKSRALIYSLATSLVVSLLWIGVGGSRTSDGLEAAAHSPIPASPPIIDLAEHGFQSVTLPTSTSRESDPNNPFVTVRKHGPPVTSPNSTVHFAIEVNNYEHVTRTFKISETLPPSLRLVADCHIPDACDSADSLTHNPTTNTLTWQGNIPPANLDYIIAPSFINLPYIDLANFDVPNLCNTFQEEMNGQCYQASVTFNLGINNYASTIYGVRQHQLTVTTDGSILFGDHAATIHGHNQMLPQKIRPNGIMAGLWREVDMTISGRWHVAILNGLIDGHDVFYAQWHDAPSSDNPNVTTRHAIAVVLDGMGEHDGHIFYIYDNVSDSAALAQDGYTIGIEDSMGLRGSSYAYAPCCHVSSPMLGYPPSSNTTLHLNPTLLNYRAEFSRVLTYLAMVNASVPSTIMSTVNVSSDSPDPTLLHTWSTHYLSVRNQTYLPLVIK